MGLVKTANGVVKVTWPAGTTALVTQPGTARVDVIYVTLGGLVQVGTQGSVNESTVCVIDKRTLNAGATATTSSSRSANRNYALPYGASLGWIAAYGEFRLNDVPTPEDMWNGTFWVPTDAKIDVIVDQAIYGDRGAHPDSDARSLGFGWCRYELHIDGSLKQTFELPYNRGYTVQKWEYLSHEVLQGSHTIRIKRVSTAGAPPRFFGGGTERLSGGFVGVRHTGISE